MVVAFVVVGVLGVALLVASLLAGDLLDGLLDAIDAGGAGGGVLSTEVIGAFLAALGFGAALLMSGPQLPAAAAAGGGAAAGVAAGAVALWLTRAFLRMPTDATPSSADLDGRIARVITRIPADGLGEVSLLVGGHRMKLSARADHPIAAGRDVVIIQAASSTSVIVTDAGI